MAVHASRSGSIPSDNKVLAWLGHPAVAAGLKLLAAGELWGDKLPSAPDRVVPAGLAAQLVTGGLAGAALARPQRSWAGGAIGAAAAIGAASLTFGLRMMALRRSSQTQTGVIEDALTVAAAQTVVARQSQSF